VQNYYQILGLPNFADSIAVKNAFRKLAKKYHPDVNPLGQENFKLLVKAYEVLSDAQAKSKYDYRLRYSLNAETKNKSTNTTGNPKNKYSYEEEMKRKAYYENLYKKPYYTQQSKEEEPPKILNEFKNILIATPLAVLLITIILNVWSHKPHIDIDVYPEYKPVPVTEEKKPRLSTGDTPYSVYFGGPTYDSSYAATLKIKNISGDDMVVFLFGKTFLRTCFIANGYETEITMLPKKLNQFKIMSGKDFQYTNELKIAGVFGAFGEFCRFYENRNSINIRKLEYITFTNFLDQGFQETKEDFFFKK